MAAVDKIQETETRKMAQVVVRAQRINDSDDTLTALDTRRIKLEICYREISKGVTGSPERVKESKADVERGRRRFAVSMARQIPVPLTQSED